MYMYIYIQVLPTGLFRTCLQVYSLDQTVEGFRKSAKVAHILKRNLQPIRSAPAFSVRNKDRPQNRDHYPTLCEKCVGSLSPSIKGSRD